MKAHDIPRILQEKVEATYEHLWLYGHERDGLLKDPLLSLDLRRNLALCVYGKALRSIPIFSSMHNNELKKLAQQLEERLYTPGDYLCMLGEIGAELFIIAAGKVHLTGPHGQPLPGCDDVVLEEGDYFGEICLLHPTRRRTCSVRAMVFCRTTVLSYSAFDRSDLNKELEHIRRESFLLRSDKSALRAAGSVMSKESTDSAESTKEAQTRQAS
jgi:CRP-like cAMP-binding protein